MKSKIIISSLIALFLFASVSAYSYNNDYKSSYMLSQKTVGNGCDAYTKTVESKRTTHTTYDYYGKQTHVSYDRNVREDYSPCNYYQNPSQTNYRYRPTYQPTRGNYVNTYTTPYYYKPMMDNSGAYNWRY